MEYEFAPLEGLTDCVYRRTHCRLYPGIRRYYTPFISPTQNHCFTPKEGRELSPQNNEGVPLVPQLLGKNAEDFLWAVNSLADMGYDEVNLNLGCPSGTVTAKGKGAGFLASPDLLDSFLDAVYSRAPISISIKTRLGLRSPEEFTRILAIYKQYPVCRLIIHPRTAVEMYNYHPHMDFFAQAVESAAVPIVYNGDLFTTHDCLAFIKQFPQTDGIMLGRGLIKDPSIVCRLNGQSQDKNILKQFHDTLCAEYPVTFKSENSALHRMKAIWSYMLDSFQNGDRYKKRLIKTKRWNDYLELTDEIFRELPLL